ncbi:MAG: MarR family winged helix-turn-helix transcriptional regulator [Roseovarius sp.]
MMKLIDILDSTPIPVGYRMAFIVNFFREPNMRRMERETGLIRPELTVLICLNFRQGLNARDICEITEQPSNTVSRAVNALLAKGLVTSTRDPVDTRRKLLGLTDEGQRLHDRVMAIFAESERRMLEALTGEEVETLTRLLDKLARDVARWSPGTQ